MASYLIGDDRLRRLDAVLRWFETGRRGAGAGLATFSQRITGPQQPWIRFYNEANATIPKYGAVILSNYRKDKEGFLVADAKRPAKFEDGPIAFNGDTQATTSDSGFALLPADDPIQVAYTGDAPEAGDFVGLSKDKFELTRHHPGFQAISNGSGGTVWVVPAPWSLMLGKVTQAIADSSSTGKATLYADKDLSMTFEVDCRDPLLSEDDEAIAVDAWVYLSLTGKREWVIHEPPCQQ